MIEFETPEGKHEYWYDAADCAKALMIRMDGKVLGRNKFTEFARFNGMLMKDSLQPKQTMITLGLMRFHMVQRRHKRYGMPLWSDRGINYIKRKLDTGDFQLGLEKKVKKFQTVKLEDIC
jgi:hypothetical protein